VTAEMIAAQENHVKTSTSAMKGSLNETSRGNRRAENTKKTYHAGTPVLG